MMPRGWHVARTLGRVLHHPSLSSGGRRTILSTSVSCRDSPRRPINLQGQMHQVRGLASDTFDSDDAVDEDVTKEDGVVSSEAYRNFLYADIQDPLFLQLNEAQSSQQVFVFLHKHQQQLTPMLISQAVMVLWDLQRSYFTFCSNEYLADSMQELKNYIKGVNGHPDFEALLRAVGQHYEQLEPDPLTCVYLYLGKMGVPLSHPVMLKLQEKCISEFHTFPLTALSRFLVASQQGSNMKTIMVTKDVFPLILNKLQTVDDAEEFRLLTICLCHLFLLMTQEHLDTFKVKTEDLIAKGVIGRHTPRVIVKILNVFNFNRMIKVDPHFIRKLFCFLEGNIHSLRAPDIVSLNRMVGHTMETAKLQEEVEEYITTCLSEQDPLSLPLELLNCSGAAAAPLYSTLQVEKIIEEHIKSSSFNDNVISIFSLLRSVKTKNRPLCDLFWNSAANYLNTHPKDYLLLLNISFKYMHFNNNMGGTYRNEQFEAASNGNLLALMRSPQRFITPIVSRSVACLLAYLREPLPAELMTQVLSMGGQFTLVDCHNLSRGIRVATMFRNGSRSPELLDQFVKISSLVSSCARKFLKKEDLNLHMTDTLLRTYQNIQGVAGTDLHEDILNNYKKVQPFDFSGRTIKDMSTLFLSTRTLIPETISSMEEYFIKAGPALFGMTAERYLNMLYTLGHSPPRCEESVQAACDLIIRDCSKLNVLALLSSALALNFFQQLPLKLIQFIFTVEFLERVDRELKACYSRAVYPVKVRQLMMELNRAVCLDSPQADIPWFHEKYCIENVVRPSNQVIYNPIHKEVYESLSRVAGGADFVKQNSISPYFYNIDFEVILDENEKPINLKDRKDFENCNITRVAVSLKHYNSFTRGIVQLIGPDLLMKRHLEMLGYRQVEISRFLWQAMYMSEESARQSYLTEQIWPNGRKGHTSLLEDHDLVIS